MKRLRSVWRTFVDFNRTRLVIGIISADVTEHKRNSDATFERAKRLSDFIGMIARTAFALFATRFFFDKANQVDGAMSYVFSYCAIASLFLTGAMGINLTMVILLYQSSDVPLNSSKIGRWMNYILAIVATVTFYLGGYALVQEIASATFGK